MKTNDRNPGSPSRPPMSRLRRLAWVAGVVVLAFVQAEFVPILSIATAQAQGTKKLALFVVPKTKKDEIPALVLKGLLRQTADRLAESGVARAQTATCEAPLPHAVIAARVERGRKALVAGKWLEAVGAYTEAETDLMKCLGLADRALVAKTFKGLGIAQWGAGKPTTAKTAVRRSFIVYPWQDASEYAYTQETRDLFVNVKREVEEAANGSLNITTTPAGAEVYVDYEFRGFGPVNVTGLAAGEHVVSVFSDGSLVWSKFVEVPSGGAADLDVPLSLSPSGQAIVEAIVTVSRTFATKAGPSSEVARIVEVTGATDVVFLGASLEKNGFGLTGVHWAAGQVTPIKAMLPRDATLVTATQEVLTSALGTNLPPEKKPAALETAPVALPGASASATPVESGEDLVIDPNSPIFKEQQKKSGEKSVFTKWWFWVAAAAVVGGATAGIVIATRQGSGSSGPTGKLSISLHGVQ